MLLGSPSLLALAHRQSESHSGEKWGLCPPVLLAGEDPRTARSDQ